MYQHSGKQGGTAGSHGEHEMLADLGKLPLTRRAAADQEWAHNPKVAGSNPAPATTKALVDGNIRQGFLASRPVYLTVYLTGWSRA